MKKVLVWITVLTIAVVSVIFFSAFNLGPTRKSKETVQVDQVSVRFPIPIIEAEQTPFYVAQDKGYYEWDL